MRTQSAHARRRFDFGGSYYSIVQPAAVRAARAREEARAREARATRAKAEREARARRLAEFSLRMRQRDYESLGVWAASRLAVAASSFSMSTVCPPRNLGPEAAGGRLSPV